MEDCKHPDGSYEVFESGMYRTVVCMSCEQVIERLPVSLRRAERKGEACAVHNPPALPPAAACDSTPVSIKSALEGGREPVSCSKHGGRLPSCDKGAGDAHHCRLSKWGSLKIADSPCPCLACHDWPEGLL